MEEINLEKTSNINPLVLRNLGLEAINTKFPSKDWFHVYTDVSVIGILTGAGAGGTYSLFSFYYHAESETKNFDSESRKPS